MPLNVGIGVRVLMVDGMIVSVGETVGVAEGLGVRVGVETRGRDEDWVGSVFVTVLETDGWEAQLHRIQIKPNRNILFILPSAITVYVRKSTQNLYEHILRYQLHKSKSPFVNACERD